MMSFIDHVWKSTHNALSKLPKSYLSMHWTHYKHQEVFFASSLFDSWKVQAKTLELMQN